MKIRTMALSTFGHFLHNKVLLVFCFLFACDFLAGIYAVRTWHSMTTASNAQQMQDHTAKDVATSMALIGGLGSLLAAWAAADSVASEVKSGTILAVMARPLRRWQFLAGKYLGVLMLMLVYVLGMVGFTIILTWMGGRSVHTPWWVLLVYPLVRYAVWAAISLFLIVTVRNPIVVMGVVAGLIWADQYIGVAVNEVPRWIRLPLHIALPLTTVVLDENRFLTMTVAAMKRYPWNDHIIALAYGLNYALVFFLLAVAAFQHRGLTHD